MLAVTGISRHGFLLPKFSTAQASLNVNLTIQSLPLHPIPPYCGRAVFFVAAQNLAFPPELCYNPIYQTS